MLARGSDGRGHAGSEDIAARRRHPDADLMASVGHNLASVYADVLGQPMPPRIVDLIERLAASTAPTPSGGAAAKG